ncbi:hypothetical protein Pmani_029448 [Petrolisthes manimaculis]|nr:hypothetical protein Pmani_029448 [Petrolisthes manimaculis]
MKEEPRSERELEIGYVFTHRICGCSSSLDEGGDFDGGRVKEMGNGGLETENWGGRRERRTGVGGVNGELGWEA